MLVLMTNTFSLKPTVSAIICDSTKPNFRLRLKVASIKMNIPPS